MCSRPVLVRTIVCCVFRDGPALVCRGYSVLCCAGRPVLVVVEGVCWFVEAYCCDVRTIVRGSSHGSARPICVGCEVVRKCRSEAIV